MRGEEEEAWFSACCGWDTELSTLTARWVLGRNDAVSVTLLTGAYICMHRLHRNAPPEHRRDIFTSSLKSSRMLRAGWVKNQTSFLSSQAVRTRTRARAGPARSGHGLCARGSFHRSSFPRSSRGRGGVEQSSPPLYKALNEGRCGAQAERSPMPAVPFRPCRAPPPGKREGERKEGGEAPPARPAAAGRGRTLPSALRPPPPPPPPAAWGRRKRRSRPVRPGGAGEARREAEAAGGQRGAERGGGERGSPPPRCPPP